MRNRNRCAVRVGNGTGSENSAYHPYAYPGSLTISLLSFSISRVSYFRFLFQEIVELHFWGSKRARHGNRFRYLVFFFSLFLFESIYFILGFCNFSCVIWSCCFSKLLKLTIMNYLLLFQFLFFCGAGSVAKFTLFVTFFSSWPFKSVVELWGKGSFLVSGIS